MKNQLIVGAAFLAATFAAPGAQAQQSSEASPATSDQVTVVGCVELEQDYRKRMAAGRGGVLGTGAGAEDEFVLTNVRPAAAAVGTSGSREGAAQAGAARQTAEGNTATVGSGGGVYTLTGPQEQELTRNVGRQIEVIGVIENAGKPDTGAELRDISDLPRIEMKSWHTVQDFCPAK